MANPFVSAGLKLTNPAVGELPAKVYPIDLAIVCQRYQVLEVLVDYGIGEQRSVIHEKNSTSY